MPSASNQYQQRITRVLIYIQEHLSEELSLEELAKVSCFSEYHFHRIFKSIVGEPVKEHIRRLRLEHALKCLVLGNQSITNIALDSGFNSHENFIRAYKKNFGQTPSTQREILKKQLDSLKKPAEKIHIEKTNNQEDLIKQIHVETLDDIEVQFIRYIGPYEEAYKAWLRLVEHVGPKTFFQDDCKKLSITHDIPGITPSDKLRFDACIHTQKNFPELNRQILKGGLYAILAHHGDINSLEGSVDQLVRIWLPNSGYEPRNHPPYYTHKNFNKFLNFKKIITEIHFPVQKIL